MKLLGLCLFLLNTLSAGMYKLTDELIRVGLGSLNGSSRFIMLVLSWEYDPCYNCWYRTFSLVL